jgi:hypothetical protein
MDGSFNTHSLRVFTFFNLYVTAVVRVSSEIVSDLHNIDRMSARLVFISQQRWASQRFFDSSQVKSFFKNFKSSQVKSSSIQEIFKSSQVKSWPKIVQVKSKFKPALIKFYFIREGSRYDTFILFQRKMIFQTKFHNK